MSIPKLTITTIDDHLGTLLGSLKRAWYIPAVAGSNWLMLYTGKDTEDLYKAVEGILEMYHNKAILRFEAIAAIENLIGSGWTELRCNVCDNAVDKLVSFSNHYAQSRVSLCKNCVTALHLAINTQAG